MFRSFLLASCLALIGTNASAQDAPPPAKFGVEDAADCAATFGWVLQYMAPNGMPQDQVMQTNFAFMMWGYELNASMPGADKPTMKAAANAAVKRLEANMPKASTEAEVERLVDVMIAKGNSCGAQLTAAYDNKPHPVMIEIQKQQDAARAADQKAREPGLQLRN